YRYYLAAWIRLFGAENRLYQCVNMFIYLITVISFFNRLRNIPVDSLFKKGFSLFVILSSPFVVKLIMMGLTEWLLVTLFIWTVYSFLHYRLLLTVVLLAMLPFLRQNLLFVSILLFVYIFISQKLGWKYVLIYIAILLLPVYHNVYYANQWKFFATYYNINSFFILEFEGSFATRLLKTFFYHIILYTGIDWLLNNLFANLLAFVCIPIGTLLYIYGIYKARLSERWWYLLITISAILPTLILGGRAYYPRFELVNLYLAALIFISIKYSESRSIPTVHNARTQSGRMDIR
ncbi:MAG: hypothetical protein ACXWCG_08350, partial [Flavitalea sp.]